MPELPEVETVCRNLSKELIGNKIQKTQVFWAKTLATHTANEFARDIGNASFTACSRRAKYLDFSLSNGFHLITHLRMSGDLYISESTLAPEKHARVYLDLNNKRQLRFDDPRKFGRIWLTREPQQIFAKLGPEPLDSSFSFQNFVSIFKNCKRNIKVALLDQRLIAGVGNIYANEALWQAGIHPLTVCNSISDEKLLALYKAIRKILTRAIASAGTDLGDGVWKQGAFRPLIYGQEGTACPRCKKNGIINLIQHIRVAQRGSDFCPKCQKPRL